MYTSSGYFVFGSNPSGLYRVALSLTPLVLVKRTVCAEPQRYCACCGLASVIFVNEASEGPVQRSGNSRKVCSVARYCSAPFALPSTVKLFDIITTFCGGFPSARPTVQ